MPYKPPHPCNHPGCSVLVSDRYCDAHRKAAHAQYNRQRDQDATKQYGTQWRRIRAAYIAEHPLCEQCERDGRLQPSREVHHVIPMSKGGDHREENLMALCKSCHSSITATEEWH